MLKRIISLILVMLMLVPFAASCNKNMINGEEGEEGSKDTDLTPSDTEKSLPTRCLTT